MGYEAFLVCQKQNTLNSSLSLLLAFRLSAGWQMALRTDSHPVRSLSMPFADTEASAPLRSQHSVAIDQGQTADPHVLVNGLYRLY
jgi:hypothetical protein